MKIICKRPYALSIAAFDPCSGAGITADIKTFENLKVMGLTVCSGITVQNESEFQKVSWTPYSLIEEQILILFKIYNIKFIKIGMIESPDIMEKILSLLYRINPDVKIIFDPILKPTSGKTIQNQYLDFLKLLKFIYVITPNIPELQEFYPDSNQNDSLKLMSEQCNVYLKGGHNENQKGRDFLILNDKMYSFRPRIFDVFPKHGSGCVLSSAITSYLALGFPLTKACLKAKIYTETFLSSSKNLLGYHKR